MAEVKWLGTADGVAQVDEIDITSNDQSTNYQVIINGDTVAVDGATTAANTAAALQAALEASTNPYFSSIDWTVTSSVITATAGDPGNPHTFTTAVVGGTGTITGPYRNKR